MGHKYAGLMAEYAKDAAEHDEPWKLWEIGCLGNWNACTHHPSWTECMDYRRKPRTITINGIDVPEPLRVKPSIGEIYHYVNVSINEHISCETPWKDDGFDNRLFNRGLCHSTKESAITHAKALLSFSAKVDV